MFGDFKPLGSMPSSGRRSRWELVVSGTKQKVYRVCHADKASSEVQLMYPDSYDKFCKIKRSGYRWNIRQFAD